MDVTDAAAGSPASASSNVTARPADRAWATCTASGSTRGAIASTVAHDAHNCMVVGRPDASGPAEMAAAVARLAEIGGGQVAVLGGRVIGEVPLAYRRARSATNARPRSPKRSRRLTEAAVERPGRDPRRAVHAAELLGVVGHPRAEDHRPRPGRRHGFLAYRRRRGLRHNEVGKLSTSTSTVVGARGRVGDRAPRPDGVPKVTGTFAYASDLHRRGHALRRDAALARSYARESGGSTPRASASPGVAAVLLAADIPGKNRFGLNFDDQPVLAEDRRALHGRADRR